MQVTQFKHTCFPTGSLQEAQKWSVGLLTYGDLKVIQTNCAAYKVQCKQIGYKVSYFNNFYIIVS